MQPASPANVAAVLEVLAKPLAWIFWFLWSRPKLAIEYASLDARSTAGPPDKLRVWWRYRLTITNLSKEDALEVVVVQSTDPQLDELGFHHLKGLDTAEVERKLEKNLDKNAVVAAHHDFHGALEPQALKDLTLVLRYKSAKGLPCYTEYVRRRQNGANAWPRRQPKRT